MIQSQNQHTARMRGGCLHETEPFTPPDERKHRLPESEVERSIEMYERVIGHAVMHGAIDCEEAMQLLRNYEAWYVVPPNSPSIVR